MHPTRRLILPGLLALGACSEGPVTRSHTPKLDTKLLDRTFPALAERAAPGLFEHVPWGTDRVMALTRAHAAAAGLRIAELRTVWDVDVEADLRRWEAELPSSGGARPGAGPVGPGSA